ncbi:MAG: hypothetical protein AAF423_05270, partial [Pseudomonadota bacterium]
RRKAHASLLGHLAKRKVGRLRPLGHLSLIQPGRKTGRVEEKRTPLYGDTLRFARVGAFDHLATCP